VFELDDKTAVVTGGGRGIGRGIALGLAAAGARVVVAGRTSATLASTVAEIEELGGKAIAVPN
jgi:NAD(P)-dependent dehydrogenase (short-subunit alcohol dehydrogenase family)